jgi:hypothetical protein
MVRLVRHEVRFFRRELIACSQLPKVTALPHLLQCNVVGDAQTLRYSPIRNAFVCQWLADRRKPQR